MALVWLQDGGEKAGRQPVRVQDDCRSLVQVQEVQVSGLNTSLTRYTWLENTHMLALGGRNRPLGQTGQQSPGGVYCW